MLNPTWRKNFATLMDIKNPMANESITENSLPVKTGNISSTDAISLIDFSTDIAKEDILLGCTIDPGDKDVSLTSEVSGTPKERQLALLTPRSFQLQWVNLMANYSSSVKFKVAADGNAHITDSSVPEAEITPATERNLTTIPDMVALAEEKITEIDLILPRK